MPLKVEEVDSDDEKKPKDPAAATNGSKSPKKEAPKSSPAKQTPKKAAKKDKDSDEEQAEQNKDDKTNRTTKKSTEEVAKKEEKPKTFREKYFPFKPWPWYAVLIVCVYVQIRMRVTYADSPCSVLGIPTTVSNTVVKRAFRTISMCTHPDRLRGRLGRDPTKYEEMKGHVLFSRHGDAKNNLSDRLIEKEKKREAKNKKREKQGLEPDESPVSVTCDEFMSTFNQVWKELQMLLTLDDAWKYVQDFVTQLLTFEAGFLATIMTFFWLMFLARVFFGMLKWMYSAGFGAPLYILNFLIIAPFPTLFRYFVLPAVRVYLAVKEGFEFLMGKSNESHDKEREPLTPPRGREKIIELAKKAQADASPSDGSVSPRGTDMSPGRGKVQTDGDLLKVGGMRRRKVEKKEKNKLGKVSTTSGAGDPEEAEEDLENKNEQLPPLDDYSLWERLTLYCDTPMKNRLDAALAVKIDFLLPLTKPLVPLAMLILTGQVWSGMISSILIVQSLKRFVPNLNYETQHMVAFFFGFVHTFVGVTAMQVEQHAEMAANEENVLKLQWQWEAKDIAMVVNMAVLGASFCSFSRLGNEPMWTLSFASGLAIRILLADDGVRDNPLVTTVGGMASDLFLNIRLQFEQVDSMVMSAGGGIGDCGGGYFRSVSFDALKYMGEDLDSKETLAKVETWSSIVAFVSKIFLAILPLYCAIEWFVRACKGFKGISAVTGTKLKKRYWRIMCRMTLSIFGLFQFLLLLNTDLNGSQGGLFNFWLALLVGATFESLMMTYESGGVFRAIVNIVIFVLV